MNLRDLEYLVTLADLRHFGRAAEACHVSQPTLSTQLRKLEEQLGVQLVERAPRRVLLTDTGAAIVERARIILREVRSIRELARQHIDPSSGTLRLGLFPTLGPYLLPHVVPRLHARYPQLELLLVEDKTEAILTQLRDGKLDAGVLAEPVDDELLDSEHLFEEPFVLAVPQSHPLAALSSVSPSDLSAHSVLLLEDGHCLRDQALEVCQLAGSAERSGFRATSLETLRQMVVARVGVTLLPLLAVRPPVPSTPGLRLLPFREPAPRRRIGLYWRRSSARGRFMNKLASALRDLPEGLLEPDSPAQPAPG